MNKQPLKDLTRYEMHFNHTFSNELVYFLLYISDFTCLTLLTSLVSYYITNQTNLVAIWQ